MLVTRRGAGYGPLLEDGDFGDGVGDEEDTGGIYDECGHGTFGSGYP